MSETTKIIQEATETQQRAASRANAKWGESDRRNREAGYQNWNRVEPE